jgi:transposase
MKVIKENVGIDVSKETLAVCLVMLHEDLSVKVKGSKTFANNQDGFKQLLAWVLSKRAPEVRLSFTMEPTGVYYENLAYFLHAQKEIVHIVLPVRAKRYAESLPGDSKTDKLDAKALGRMGVERSLDVWQIETPIYKDLKQLTRERESLIKERTNVKNRLHALLNSANPFQKSIKRLKGLIKYFDKQIQAIEEDIKDLVMSEEWLRKKVEQVISIPGVGLLTAVIIIAETNGFALIKSIKQLVSYAGLDVKIRESGAWKGKSKISKKGNVHIRKAMYFPAYTNMKHSKNYLGLYSRIFAKKQKSLIAATATQKKLLGLIYTLWKNETVYIEDYQQLKSLTERNKKISGNTETMPSLCFLRE